jgi:asparagine N-glycosylation enzyme membrane subunit Stt3
MRIARMAKKFFLTMVVLGLIATSFLSCSQPLSVLYTPTPTISDDWQESLVWMRQNTPDPFTDPNSLDKYAPCTIPGQDYNYPESAYWVMSGIDYGCMIIDIARRLPNTIAPEKGVADAGSFFTALNESSANTMLNRLGSKYVIIDSSMATGKFFTMAVAAGKDKSQFSDVFYQITQTGTPQAVILYYPEYYESMCSRLYLFGGQQWIPEQVTVISWDERYLTTDGGSPFQAKVITDQKSFTTYDSAKAFVDAHPDYRIMGSNPLSSPVPLEKLEHYKLIHRSPTSVAQRGNETICAVEVFEYTP